MRRLEYKWLVGITFVLGLIMQLLDITILNVALATLGREFQVDEGTLQWVLTGYMISLAVFIPASGWLADRFGSKRTFQLAVVVFTLASVLCGLATEMWMLIAARVLQGVGGGMLVPVGQAMLFRAFPANERAKASAVLAIPITVAPMLGPVLGGALVEYASWRWIFFINVPVGMIALVFTVIFLREETQARPGRFDLPGFVFAGVGLAALLYSLDQGGQSAWQAPSVWVVLASALLLIAALVWRELSTAAPMLNIRLLGNRMFGTGNALLMCSTVAMFSIMFLMPLYLQNLRGVSPMTAGLMLTPQALTMLLVTQVISRLYVRVGPRRLLLTGFALQTTAVASMQVLGLDTPLALIIGLLTLQGTSMGLLMTPLQTAAFAQVSSASMGHASSMFNVSRQVATALGTAIVATVLVVLTSSELSGVDPAATEEVLRARMAAYNGAFAPAVLAALLGFTLSWFVRDADAAATLNQSRKHESTRTSTG